MVGVMGDLVVVVVHVKMLVMGLLMVLVVRAQEMQP
jgi:hypothetical protein